MLVALCRLTMSVRIDGASPMFHLLRHETIHERSSALIVRSIARCSLDNKKWAFNYIIT